MAVTTCSESFFPFQPCQLCLRGVPLGLSASSCMHIQRNRIARVYRGCKTATSLFVPYDWPRFAAPCDESGSFASENLAPPPAIPRVAPVLQGSSRPAGFLAAWTRRNVVIIGSELNYRYRKIRYLQRNWFHWSTILTPVAAFCYWFIQDRFFFATKHDDWYKERKKVRCNEVREILREWKCNWR